MRTEKNGYLPPEGKSQYFFHVLQEFPACRDATVLTRLIFAVLDRTKVFNRMEFMRFFSFVALSALTLGTPLAGVAGTLTYTDLATYQAATTGLVTETFEDTTIWPAESVSSGSVSNLGLVWTATETLAVGSQNGDRVIASTDFPQDDNDEIRASVTASGITAVGGLVRSFSGAFGVVTLSAYGAGDVLLGSVSFDDPRTSNLEVPAFAFLGLTTDTTISRFSFATTKRDGQDDFVLNDVSFGQGPVMSAVPLPASMPLLLAGVFAIGAVRKRGRSSAPSPVS
jgi:hypothetical protein